MTVLTSGKIMPNLLSITAAKNVVLISGAASGIGAVQTQQFTAAGAQVFLAAIDVERASEMSHEIRRVGSKAENA